MYKNTASNGIQIPTKNKHMDGYMNGNFRLTTLGCTNFASMGNMLSQNNSFLSLYETEEFSHTGKDIAYVTE